MHWQPLVPELVVSDFGRSLNFYETVLGFEKKYVRSLPSFAYLEFERSQLMIEELQSDSWIVGELSHPFGRGMNLQIECRNVEEMRKRVDGSEGRVFVELHDAWYECGDTRFGQRQFVVADPDGYLLRFCQIIGEQRLDV